MEKKEKELKKSPTQDKSDMEYYNQTITGFYIIQLAFSCLKKKINKNTSFKSKNSSILPQKSEIKHLESKFILPLTDSRVHNPKQPKPFRILSHSHPEIAEKGYKLKGNLT